MLTLEFKTRIAKGGEAHKTIVEFDFSTATKEDVEKLAARSIVIALQANYRTAGVVPDTDTVDVGEFLSRERKPGKVTPESLAARINKMSPEEKAYLLNMVERGEV